MKKLILNIFAIISCCLFVNASDSLNNASPLTLDDKDSIKISLLPESEAPVQVSDADKPILRYGFHRTHDCTNFEKAFICVRKCLDLDYQIAHADKNCVCTCYRNTMLAKYKPLITDSEKWKLGAPTTSLPPWAAKEKQKPNDYEINANYTEFIEDHTTKAKKVPLAAHADEENNAGGDQTTIEGADKEGVHDAPPAEEEAPAEAVPEEEAPAEAAPEGEAPAEDAPAEEAPAEEAPAEDAPAEGDAAAEPAPADGTEAPPAE